MKTVLRLIVFCFLALGIFHPVRACLDTIPRIHAAVCYYDSSDYIDMVLRIGSLRTATSPQGTWCSCVLHNNHPVLDWIDYIAVVDSGTNNRAAGFGAWYRDTIVDEAWDSVYHIGWKGFLSQLMTVGTTAGTPVELIIRAHINGYGMPYLSNDLRPTILGWDNWDFNTQFPANVHRWWRDMPIGPDFVFIPIAKTDPFFDNFDADLLYVGVEEEASFLGLEVFPNPSVDVLHVRLPLLHLGFSYEVFDGLGRPVARGVASGAVDLDVVGLEAGVYFLRVVVGKTVVTRRFVRV